MRSVYVCGCVFARLHTCVCVCRYALRECISETEREGEYTKVYEVRIPMGGLSETNPSHLPCWNASVRFSLSLSFFPFSLSRLNLGRGFLRLIHTCNTPQKCRADEERIRANQLHFTSAKRTETRDAFRIFLRAANFLRAALSR